MNRTRTTSTDPIERLARRRAGAKLGWYIHAGVYIAVNLLLALLSAMSDRHWAVFPALWLGHRPGHPRRGGVPGDRRRRPA
jgi:hypothetical protein